MVFALGFLSYSSSAYAYTQLYQIGSTGPNGGTVTSVNVDSVLIGTTTSVVGDVVTTTYNYTYTETVLESVTSTTTQTVTSTITSTQTTQSIISPGVNLTQSNVSDFSCGASTGFNCKTFTYTNGYVQWSSNGPISSYVNGDIHNGFTITGGAFIAGCLNNIGGYCENTATGTPDIVTITVSVTDPTLGLTWSNAQTFYINHTDFRSYSTSLTMGENTLSNSTKGAVMFSGYDPGYWGGYYGATIKDPFLYVTYDIIQYITQQVTTQITNTIETVIQSQESERKTSYSPTSTNNLEVSVSDGTGVISTFSANISDAGNNTVNVTMTSTTDEGSTTENVGSFTVEKTDSGSSDSKSSADAKPKSESEKKESKEAVGSKIMADILNRQNETFGGGDTTRLAVMIAVGSDPSKNQPNLKDADQWYMEKDIYGNKELKDPTSALFNIAQDKLMDKLMELQYKNGDLN